MQEKTEHEMDMGFLPWFRISSGSPGWRRMCGLPRCSFPILKMVRIPFTKPAQYMWLAGCTIWHLLSSVRKSSPKLSEGGGEALNNLSEGKTEVKVRTSDKIARFSAAD